MTLKTRLSKLEGVAGAWRPNISVKEMPTPQLEALVRRMYGLPKDAELTMEMLQAMAEGEICPL